MMKLHYIEEAAKRILDNDPHPVVRYRLLRDVLRMPRDCKEVASARHALDSSRWVKLLADEQYPDGGWGKFHTRNYSLKQKTHTTEAGVERALMLGLEPDHPVLQKTTAYIVGILEGRTPFPDRAEKNDLWPVGAEMFAAAQLSQIQPDHPILVPIWERWAESVTRSFASGEFDDEAELLALQEVHNVHGGVGYLSLLNKYAVALIGSRTDQLPKQVEKAYARWLWNRDRGLLYLEVPLSKPPAVLKGSWFTTVNLLSVFSNWRDLAKDSIEWLWNQRNEIGLWDFGPKWKYQRLSEDWREKERRSHDHSTHALLLLRRYMPSATTRN